MDPMESNLEFRIRFVRHGDFVGFRVSIYVNGSDVSIDANDILSFKVADDGLRKAALKFYATYTVSPRMYFLLMRLRLSR